MTAQLLDLPEPQTDLPLHEKEIMPHAQSQNDFSPTNTVKTLLSWKAPGRPFKKRDGIEVLHIRTYAFIPGELTITLGDVHKEHAKSVLLPYLPYREYIKPTIMEKSADWLSRNFPLEKAKT